MRPGGFAKFAAFCSMQLREGARRSSYPDATPGNVCVSTAPFGSIGDQGITVTEVSHDVRTVTS